MVTTLLQYLSSDDDTQLVTRYDDSTKLAAYKRVLSSGLLSSQQNAIAQYLFAFPNSSYEDINDGLFFGRKINAVCGRMNELRKNGIVVVSGYKTSTKTGMRQVTWVLV